MNTNNNSSNFWLQVKKEYIDEKDKFYKRVRANRKTDSVGQN